MLQSSLQNALSVQRRRHIFPHAAHHGIRHVGINLSFRRFFEFHVDISKRTIQNSLQTRIARKIAGHLQQPEIVQGKHSRPMRRFFVPLAPFQASVATSERRQHADGGFDIVFYASGIEQQRESCHAFAVALRSLHPRSGSQSGYQGVVLLETRCDVISFPCLHGFCHLRRTLHDSACGACGKERVHCTGSTRGLVFYKTRKRFYYAP